MEPSESELHLRLDALDPQHAHAVRVGGRMLKESGLADAGLAVQKQ